MMDAEPAAGRGLAAGWPVWYCSQRWPTAIRPGMGGREVKRGAGSDVCRLDWSRPARGAPR